MSTTKENLKEWFEAGVAQGATHMIVFVDLFDYDDYPEYVMPGQDAKAIVKIKNGVNMQKVMEVYHLTEDMEEQLSERFCTRF